MSRYRLSSSKVNLTLSGTRSTVRRVATAIARSTGADVECTPVASPKRRTRKSAAPKRRAAPKRKRAAAKPRRRKVAARRASAPKKRVRRRTVKRASPKRRKRGRRR